MFCRKSPAVIALACLTPLIWTAQTWALNPGQLLSQYQRRVWTEREGLPHSTVQAIAQTPEGYLWVGTRDGLARFDGVTFKVFKSEGEPGLGSSDIRALLCGRDGTLWIGTFNGGLSCYTNGRFARLQLPDLPSSGVIGLFEDSSARLWLGTWNGLGCLSEGKLTVFSAAAGVFGKRVWSVAEDQGGRIWAATSRGLRVSSGDFKRFEPRKGPECRLLRKLFVDDAGTLWTGSIGQGLAGWDGGTWRQYHASDGVADDRVNAILQDRNKSLWVGTWGGLTRINNGEIASLKSVDGLPHDCVECLFEDREGSLWIGTRGGGLVQMEDAVVTGFTSRHGLASDQTKCVMQASDGSMWIGTEGGGTSRFRDGVFENFTTKDGLPSNFICALAEGSDGSLWFGSAHPAALIRFKDGRFTTFTGRHGFEVEHQVRAIHVDPDGGVWAGGEEGGLSHFRDGKFFTYTTANGLPADLVRVVFRDRTGRLWVATGGGLCWFREGRFEMCPGQDKLPDRTVYSACEDASGTIWLGTQHGLARFQDGRFSSFPLEEGLANDVIYQVLHDRTGTLWLSTSRGIFSVSREAVADFERGKTKRVTSLAYGVADGMKSTHCEGGSQPAGCRDVSGRLWFPTAAGVTLIDSTRIKRKLDPGPVRIEEVTVGARTFPPGSTPHRFGPSVRPVQFTYTVLSLAASGRVEFRHRLRGYDDNWLEAQTRRVARYTELPAGNYVFEVAARVPAGEWQARGAEFAFSVAPHFYETTWFLLLCLGLAGVSAWSLHRWRMRQAQAGFALVLAERNRIARELHDTLAQGFAGTAFQLQAVSANLTQSPEMAKKHLDLAVKMVRHSMAEARRSVMNMRSADLENAGLADALSETARYLTAGRDLQVEVAHRGPARPIPAVVEDELLRIGQEAISNAIEHSSARNLRMGIEYAPDKLLLRIEDDGKGFDSATHLDFRGAHFGLLGMRERTGRIGGRLEIRSRPGEGTRVLVEVPLDQP